MLILVWMTALLASQPLRFEISDAQGKQTSAVRIEAGAPDNDGWRPLELAKSKGDAVLVWPFDGWAKLPDGPGPIPAIVIQKGAEKALANKRAVAAMATPIVLGTATLEKIAGETGFAGASLAKSFADLETSADPLEKGVGLLYAGKFADAAEQLAIALKQRQRQLTRVPSEIYPVAMLYGNALFRSNKFDAAAVAFLTALRERPSDTLASMNRAEALTKAGKPEAAGR